jgi:hypothetical protein
VLQQGKAIVRQAKFDRKVAFVDVGRGVEATQQLRRSRLAVDFDLSTAHT